jgi:hypothetical protein
MQPIPSTNVSRPAKKDRARGNRRRPLGVEVLENRTCMSCVVTTTDGGHTLVITGDGSANNVAIEVNDVANTLTVTCDGESSTYTSSSITKLMVDLKGGNDNLWMGLAPGSHNAFTKKAIITLGAGDDTATLDFWHGIGEDVLLQGSLDIEVYGNSGADVLDADFGHKHGGSLKLYASLGAGEDQAFARMWGDITGGADVLFDLRGGSDNDLLNTWNTYDNAESAYGAIDITHDSSFTINLKGGSGADQLFGTYAGELDGDLVIRMAGGDGNDTIKMAQSDNGGIHLADGSSGSVDAIFTGGTGNDYMAVTLNEDPNGNVDLLNALMDGGSGFDTWNWLDTTSNMTKQGFEKASPLLIFVPILTI